MAFDSVYVESCENFLFTDAVDIGADDAAENDHGVLVGGWGPPEPQTHGGSWGGIAANPEDRTCRVVWEAGSTDAERNATIYLNHGTNTSRKDVLMNVLEGLAQDAFEIYIDEVDDRNLLYKYGGLHFTLETWVAHTLNYHATGVHTLVLRANPTDDDPWYGFNSFGKVAVRNIILGVDRHPDESPLFVLEDNPDWIETGGAFRQSSQPGGESKVLSYNQGKNSWSFWAHMAPLGPLDAMGVVFDYLDENNYATAMLSSAGGERLEIKRCSDGVWSLIADAPVAAPAYPARLGLFKRAGTVTVELGDVSHDVPSSTDGLIGLITKDMMAEFSDVFFLPTIGDFETPFTIEGTTDVPPRDHRNFMLLGNYPNPFGPSTTLLFELAERSPVELGIYDASGRLMRRMAEQVYPAGRNAIRWDGRDEDGRRVSSGVYFYRMRVPGGFSNAGKMTLAR